MLVQEGHVALFEGMKNGIGIDRSQFGQIRERTAIAVTIRTVTGGARRKFGFASGGIATG